jgi:PAS domain S-box-containing protein
LWQIDAEGARRIASDKVGGDKVIAQFEDSKGRIWMGDGHGVTMFDGERFSIYGAKQGLPDGDVRCFAEDSAQSVWLTNQNGVFRWEKNRFVEVENLRNVSCLSGDADGVMWIGLAEGGLVRWRNNRLDRIDASAGFPAVNVLGILDDGIGCFWMASNRGVIRIPRKELEACADGTASRINPILLGTEDGLPGVECAGGNQPVCAKDATGKLWFATMKGVAVIDPADFEINALPPSIQIEGLVYYGESAKSGRATQQHSLLPAGSRRIEVHYTALSFVAPEKVRFQSRLEGQDREWQDMDNRRTAYFHDLEPGHYVFRVRAANNDGVWNNEGEKLAFTLQPFYWQTWWFRASVAMLLVMMGAGIYWRVSRWRNRLAREEQQRLRQVFEASPNAIITVDERGKIVLVNQEATTVFGYEQDELIGASVDMLLPEGARASDAKNRRAYLGDLQTRSMRPDHDVSGRRKDGSKVPLEIRLSAVGTAKGKLMLASIADITARRRSEREMAEQRNELAHLSRVTMMGELSGSMAHELNQPLTAILSNAQAALRYLAHEATDLDEVRGILKDIVEEDKRAGEVIGRLRLLFQKGEVLFQPLNVNEAIEDVLKLLHSDLVNHNVVVDGDLAQRLPDVYGDRVQFQQVLINLIINGCDAMANTKHSKRRLSVRTESANGDGVRITVGDQGCGISPDRLETVFEPFVTTKSKGMGLGLAVCRTIITAHGGRLWAENMPDAGACFVFTLPTQKKAIA